MSVEQAFGKWLNRFILLPFLILLTFFNVVLWTSGHENRVYHFLVISAGICASLALLIVVRLKAWRKAKDLFIGPFDEVFAAGRWTLENLLGRQPQHLQIGNDMYGDTAQDIVDQLDDWEEQNRKQVGSLTAEQQSEMRQDLDLAMEFQQAYLNRPYPKVPRVHVQGRLRLKFYHRYEPALALGGDFFDILTFGPDCAGIMIADVMGHGTRSALITAVIRTLVGDLAQFGRNAPHFITALNKQMCQLLQVIPQPIFASAGYFVADTTARVATYTTAGHPAPFHLRRSVGRISRLEVEGVHGAALGVLENEEYSGGNCRLIAGDVFLFFTDGVYEAQNRHGEEFGIARMETVMRSVLYKPGNLIVDAIMAAVEGFVGSRQILDDICMVSVEVTTEEAPIS